MNKKDLVRTISQELDPPLSQDKIALVLDKAVEIAKRTLATGESVRWSGFGSFIVKDIPPRRFYSPKRKEYVVSKGVKKITFLPSRPK
ncbi:MAG: HU family DNA-binding protein [Alistipes senegalensis]|nr:HU family DNA-binding protein [Bacteroides cellulosilyticus]MCM1353036.1 HU family DNA-binding protein [Alistipes senegalensis]